jgi:aminocarboxycyclopropane-forming enzyme
MSDRELFIGYDHVAYATRDTDATVKLLEVLGFAVKIHRQELDKFNVYVTKMMLNGGAVAEIVEPRGERSAVSKVLADKESSVYHACFKTNDFHAALDKLKKFGAVTITKPMRIPYPVTEEHRTFLDVHLYHPSLGLFEITGPG